MMARRGPGRSQAARPVFAITDEVACYFDTPDEPANVHLEVRVPFHLDRAAFRDAAVAALAASPRAAGAVPQSPLRRHYFWEHPAELDVDPVSCTTFADESQLAAQRNSFTARAPSLDESPAARILLATGSDCDYVILNGHHAAMDGTAWLEVLRDVGRRYRASQAVAASQTAGPAAGTRYRAAGPPRPTAADRSGTRPGRPRDPGGRACPQGSRLTGAGSAASESISPCCQACRASPRPPARPTARR